MFDERALVDEVDAVRSAHAPGTLVVDCERDFETLPPAVAEELGLFDALDTEAYRQYGAEYAVQWAEKTFARMA
jgi:hypothetical protein